MPEGWKPNGYTDSSMGCLTGIVCYLGAMITVCVVVPTKQEGIRDVVDVPWEVFAWLPFCLAMFVALAIWVALRIYRHRAVYGFLVTTILIVGTCTIFSIGLLRRIHIGKF